VEKSALSPAEKNGVMMVDRIRVGSHSKLVRSIVIAAALWACVAIAGDRTNAAAPDDAFNQVFSSTDGDRSSIQSIREPDGRMKVTIHGDFYDGRRLLTAIFAGLSGSDPTDSFDIDLNVKVATFAGFNGEVLRNVALKLSGRGGELLEFVVAAKIGSGADLMGELQSGRDGRRIIYLDADDAGALFRFLNVYDRMHKGRMRLELDAPTADHAAQNGRVDVQHFAIVDEPASMPVVRQLRAMRSQASAKSPDVEPLEISRLQAGFKLLPGNIVVSDGLLKGPSIGATVAGQIDFTGIGVDLGGAVLPPDRSNRHIPDFEHSFTYKIAGSPHAPTLRINPIAALAPGILRKLSASTPEWK
jgi:hypothetical protein